MQECRLTFELATSSFAFDWWGKVNKQQQQQQQVGQNIWSSFDICKFFQRLSSEINEGWVGFAEQQQNLKKEQVFQNREIRVLIDQAWIGESNICHKSFLANRNISVY